MKTKDHWENVYSKEKDDQLSWYQNKPEISLQLIKNSTLKKDARIVDIGGGTSLLTDYLLNEGYNNLTVLDVSARAIEMAKKRLDQKAEMVTGSKPT